MVNVVKIKLWDKEVGALSWDKERQYAYFQYYQDFKQNGWDISPLHMPVTNKIYSFPQLNRATYSGLPGLLSDVLPDDFGNRLIGQWLEMNNINKADFSPVDRLSYIGKRGMGAMEFEPVHKKYNNLSTPLEVARMVELAASVMDDRKQLSLKLQDDEDLKELIKVGTSAGGQRPKAIIAFNPETLEIRSGQTDVPKGFEHYLFKFDGASNKVLGDPEGYGRIEFAYYNMAVDCGIEMRESKLYEENGRAHFMTKRFDRIANNKKLHMQTLCSLAHFDYQQAGAYSYENAFEVMRQLRLPHSQAIQLYKRMVFNVLARNQDDHTKNISFLMNDKGEWKLSPAYDITYAYNPSGFWTSSHQMTINTKRDNFSLQDLLEVGSRISYKGAREAVEEIAEVIKEWKRYSKVAGIPVRQSKALERSFRQDILQAL